MYFVAKALQDLDYFGSNTKWSPGAWSSIVPNPYWSAFFRELRAYLDISNLTSISSTISSLKDRGVPPSGAWFLWEIYRDDIRRLAPAEAEQLLAELGVDQIDEASQTPAQAG